MSIKPLKSSTARPRCFGEAKWSRRPVGTNILNDLEVKSEIAQIKSRLQSKQYVLFSRSGFTDALLRKASNRPDLHLVHQLDLIEPPTSTKSNAQA